MYFDNNNDWKQYFQNSKLRAVHKTLAIIIGCYYSSITNINAKFQKLEVSVMQIHIITCQ